MNPGDTLLFITVFAAAAVEMVEALTIVLAIGLTRGWRETALASAAALALLAAGVAVLGSAFRLIPIGPLHLVVGGLLLIFGLQWLRQAILRAGGFLAQRDEAALYKTAAKQAKHTQRTPFDWYGFTVVFKGVLLEGTEVIFIVLGFGAAQRNLPVASLGALAGLVVVGLAGIAVHKPLSKVPENTLKFIVGVMLTCFGLFWGGAGAGLQWPGGNAAVLGLLAFVLPISWGTIWLLRQIASPESAGKAS